MSAPSWTSELSGLRQAGATTDSDGLGGMIGTAIKNYAGFIWSVADLLRGVYRQSEYGRVILPLTVLRRLDCVLEPTKGRGARYNGRSPGHAAATASRLLQQAAG